MYKNLEAEMARNSIDKYDIAATIGRAYNTTITRFRRSPAFTIDEAIKIQETYFPNHSLEYLFESIEST